MRFLALLFLLLPLVASADMSFVGATTDRAASDTSVAPAEHGSAAEGDLFLGVAWTDVEDGAWSCPTSWTELDNNISAVTSGHSLVCYIVRTGSTPNLTFSYTGTAANIRAVVYVLRGQHADIFDTTYATGSHYQESTDDPTAANPDVVINTVGAMAVLFQINEFSAAGTPVAPSGYTLDSTGHGLKPQINMAYKVAASTGTEDPPVWGHTGFNSGEDPLAYTLAIKPSSNATLRRRR